MNRRSLLGRALAALGLGATAKAGLGGLPHEYKMGIDLAPGASQAQRTCWEMTDGMLVAASDRLWVGPERQAWCDIGIAPDASVTYPGSRHRFCWIGDAPCRDGNPDDEVLHETVLGVDGRWRWTLDLGIEPR